MAKPSEICVVTAGGTKYDNWETVEVSSAVDNVIHHAMLTVSEPSSGAKNFASIKLKPGDPATVTLAGQTVIEGMVYLRQGVTDANSHSVQIGICSKAQPIMTATVDAEPGQYTDKTLEQILTEVFGKEGVKFKLQNAPAGADKKFPRVSEHVGETKFALAERLGRMRNIHYADDGEGGIIGFRGPNGDAATQVVQGYNMLRGRILLKNNESSIKVVGLGQQSNQESGDDNAHSRAEKTIDTTAKASIAKFVCEDSADNQDCQMRVDHESDWLAYEEVDGDVTVQGWLNGQSRLWWEDRLKVIVVKSPLLLPNDSFGFMIKSVIHRQSSEGGTTTTLELCKANGLGGGAPPLQGLV